MSSPKPPVQQVMWPQELEEGSTQPAYGIPVSFTPYAAGVALPTMAAAEGEPAMGVPVGSVSPDQRLGPQMPYTRGYLTLGTEQEHDAALVATCCCGKWGLLGTVLCCPSRAGIAGMCQGCGLNLISTAIAYSLFLVMNLYAFHGPKSPPEWMEHHPDITGSRQPPLVFLGFVSAAMVLIGAVCLLYGSRQAERWRQLATHVVPVATVDLEVGM
eukprot:TRINITY_DN300_c0_g1_i1.p1 TRINITY_DN300_c0_g1~~TRINITY_DN300_c0_g1_i1.p1  ORF type:complete len:222 (-),score=28.83 TRINITY_DN300_c0_g1_i1:214-855(-)